MAFDLFKVFRKWDPHSCYVTLWSNEGYKFSTYSKYRWDGGSFKIEPLIFKIPSDLTFGPEFKVDVRIADCTVEICHLDGRLAVRAGDEIVFTPTLYLKGS